jgi:hypothetical protein
MNNLDKAKVELYKELLSIPNDDLTDVELNLMYSLCNETAIHDEVSRIIEKELYNV